MKSPGIIEEWLLYTPYKFQPDLAFTTDFVDLKNEKLDNICEPCTFLHIKLNKFNIWNSLPS